MGSEDLVRRSEKEVIEAAKEWVRSLPSDRPLTPQEQRLKMALFMLKKASGLSGEHRIDLDKLKGL